MCVCVCVCSGGERGGSQGGTSDGLEIRQVEPRAQGLQVRGHKRVRRGVRRVESSFFLSGSSQSGGPGSHSHGNESVKSHLLPPLTHTHTHTEQIFVT